MNDISYNYLKKRFSDLYEAVCIYQISKKSNDFLVVAQILDEIYKILS